MRKQADATGQVAKPGVSGGPVVAGVPGILATAHTVIPGMPHNMQQPMMQPAANVGSAAGVSMGSVSIPMK